MGDPEKAYLLAFIGYVKGLTSSLVTTLDIVVNHAHQCISKKAHWGSTAYTGKFSLESVFSEDGILTIKEAEISHKICSNLWFKIVDFSSLVNDQLNFATWLTMDQE